ncbi:carbohydrate sulfotransferase 15-like isoform X1 [Gadus chalcogrammus]|uniref:carbohydrate sulfotransferase 15-like isoform X1 n=1 Tax=Gadus chalcogrammus TaxID=1042646 RepID=UPI0024C47C53|nr:carbohydrate sulfotransferase 15-like isoform X1 [Gadus chalcogrammus]XP_056433800.1 carbohydrate sulfotransferase 15-like isoform X1 [Gadus chalcogrammus]
MTPMDYKYSLLTAAPSDDYGQGPVLLLHTDPSPGGLFGVLEVRRGDVAAWHRSALGFLNRLKVCSFMCFLTVTFLVTASYMLLADRKGLLLTPPPYRFGSPVSPVSPASPVSPVSPASPAALDFNLSASRDLAHVRLVVKSIVARVAFQSSRRLPERKALVSSEPHMFSVIPRKFLPGLKNPCWYEEYTGNNTSDPYGNNKYEFSKRFRTLLKFLRNSFREHLFHWDGKLYRTRCLPYFYIIGQPKCGTTDLYDRLRMHPDVRFGISKEPHWWTRKRFGIVRLKDGVHDRFPVEDYLDLFDLSAFQIQDQLSANASRARDLPYPQRHIIIGEASASTMWDNKAWTYYSDNSTTEEPPYLNQDFIHALQPDARLIVIFRDPVERLYSDYLYFGGTNKSAEDFHEKVSESLQLFDGCVAMTTIRSCVYNSTLNNGMPIRMPVGLYVVFLLDWLTIFHRDQLLVLRLEDHALNRKYTMKRVFDFLHLGPLTEQQEAEITQSPASNTRKEANRNLGPMLASTRDLLQDFYKPFNQKLAQVLHNNSFLWDGP